MLVCVIFIDNYEGSILRSTVGFKNPRSDLHRWSSRIFLVSLVVSLVVTTVILNLNIPEPAKKMEKISTPPVIIHLTEIPQTRQTIEVPAPPLPFNPSGMPIAVDEDIMPDEVTIEDTKLEPDSASMGPPQVYVPSVDAGVVESEIYEYHAVEEMPERITGVIPEYPPVASRAGIEGSVSLKVLVNTEGTVDSVIVIDGPELFHDAAITAAKKTEFTPARQNDRPVACWVILPFRFTLKK